jgi:hypothetical protein
MNERIRELAEQAQKVVGYTDGGYTEIKALDQEKFAQLIVRECAGVAIDNGCGDFVDIKQKLFEHFGVEE